MKNKLPKPDQHYLSFLTTFHLMWKAMTYIFLISYLNTLCYVFKWRPQNPFTIITNSINDQVDREMCTVLMFILGDRIRFKLNWIIPLLLHLYTIAKFCCVGNTEQESDVSDTSAQRKLFCVPLPGMNSLPPYWQVRKHGLAFKI